MRGSALVLLRLAAPALPDAEAASAQVADWTQGWSGQATIAGWLHSFTGAQEGRVRPSLISTARTS